MERREASLWLALILAFCRLLEGQTTLISCSDLNALANNVNTQQLGFCQRRDDCSGVECQNENNQLRVEVELFDVRFLPCAEPAPAVWLQLWGQQDLVHGGQRRLKLNQTVEHTGVTEYPVSINSVQFGVYRFMINVSNTSSSVGIAVELTRTSGSRTPVINYTEIQFDLSCCSVQVTTTTEPIKGSTGSMTTTNGVQRDTPTGMNNDRLRVETSRDLQPRQSMVLNFIPVTLTVIVAMTTLLS